MDTVDYLLENYDFDLGKGLEGAAHGDNRIDKKGANDIQGVFIEAVKSNIISLVKFLITQGVVDLNKGLYVAANTGKLIW